MKSWLFVTDHLTVYTVKVFNRANSCKNWSVNFFQRRNVGKCLSFCIVCVCLHSCVHIHGFLMDILLNGHRISAKGELQSLCCMMGKTMLPRCHFLATNGWQLATILWHSRTTLFCRGIICSTHNLTHLIRRFLKAFHYKFYHIKNVKARCKKLFQFF